MIKFKLGESELECFDYAKHHKRISVQIERKYNDGKIVDLINDDTFRKDVDANPDQVFTKANRIYRNGDLELVEDKYVWFTNVDYIDGDLEYYSTGASNTKQTTYVRLKFQFEYGRAYLDYKYKSSGSYSTTFANVIGNGIRSIVDEIMMEDGCCLEKDGIAFNEDGEIMMMITDESGDPVSCEVNIYEIEDAFIGAEVYKFEQEIVTDNKELEEMR